jgi:hypothetical protein
MNCVNEPSNANFPTIDGGTGSVGSSTNCPGCFAYWSSTLNGIAWAWWCDTQIDMCPLPTTSCSGSCAGGITCF